MILEELKSCRGGQDRCEISQARRYGTEAPEDLLKQFGNALTYGSLAKLLGWEVPLGLKD